MYKKTWFLFLVIFLVLSTVVSANFFRPESPPQGPPFINGDNVWNGINNFTGPVFISNLTTCNVNNTVVAGSVNASTFCITDNGCVVNWTTDTGIWVLVGDYIRPYNFDYDVRASSINATTYYIGNNNINDVFVNITGDTMTGDLVIDKDGIGDASLKLVSDSGSYACINLTEGGPLEQGFQICNDGAGINEFVISSIETGDIFMTISRDDGDITFFNNTIFDASATFDEGVTSDEFCIGGDCITDWDSSGLWVLTDDYIEPVNFSYDVRASSINATYGYFEELNVSNSSIHIGGVKLSGGIDELFVSEGEGNVTAKYYYGSGQFLTDINLSSVNGTALFNDDVTIGGDLTVNGNLTAPNVENIPQELNITITGNGTGQITHLFPESAITQVTVLPTTTTNSYTIKVDSDGGLNSIDISDYVYTGDTAMPFQVQSSATYMNFSLQNVTINEDVIIRLRWRN